MFLPPYTDFAPQVEASYPGGARIEGRAKDGRLLYIAYRVT